MIIFNKEEKIAILELRINKIKHRIYNGTLNIHDGKNKINKLDSKIENLRKKG